MKNLKNLGKALSKAEQVKIIGGRLAPPPPGINCVVYELNLSGQCGIYQVFNLTTCKCENIVI